MKPTGVNRGELPRHKPDAVCPLPVHTRSRRQNLRTPAVAALAGLALIASVTSWGDWAVWMPDSFWYLDNARSLAMTGSLLPERFLRPPGFCVMLAPMVALEGDLPVLTLKLFMTACLIATTLVTYHLHRPLLPPRHAWIAAACVALCPALLRLGNSFLSEVPFTLLACGTLLFCGRWRTKGVHHLGEAVAVGALIVAAVFTRTIGLVLLPIALISAWSSTSGPRPVKGRPVAVILLICLVPLVAWQIRQSGYPPASSYVDALKIDSRGDDAADGAIVRLLERVTRYGMIRLDGLKELILSPAVFWRLFQPPLGTPTSLLIGGLAVGIAAFRAWKHRHPMDAYVLLSLPILAVWPYDEGVRMVAPLAPIVLAYPLWLIAQIESRRVNGRAVGVMATSAVWAWPALLGVGWLTWFGNLDAQREKSSRTMAGMESLAEWQRRHVREDQRLLALTPRGAEEKLHLLGAAYLSRRRITSVYALPDRPPGVALTDYDAAVVHESLVATARSAWQVEPTERHGTLHLFRAGATALTADRDGCSPRPTSLRSSTAQGPSPFPGDP